MLRFILAVILGVSALLACHAWSRVSEQGREFNPRYAAAWVVDELSAAADKMAFEIRDVWRICTANPAPKPKLIPVRQKLGKVKWQRRKANPKAEYYFYLHFCKSCPGCRELMGYFASRYEEMKKDGRVEILMISYDDNPTAEAAYLDEFNLRIPWAHRSDPALNELPGIIFDTGFPSVQLVKASGQTINTGSGHMIVFWRKYTVDAAAERAKKEAAKRIRWF